MFGYEPVQPEWIERRILWLLKTLEKRDASFRTRQNGTFLDPRDLYMLLQRNDLTAALPVVASRYGIDPSRVSWEYADELSGCNTIAQVVSTPGGPILVDLHRHLRFEAINLGAALAHELGHAYLTDLNIVSGGTWMAEATTDLLTLVSGLGKVTVNSVGNLNLGGAAGTPCMGYLNREALVFAYALACDELGISPEMQEVGLTSEASSYLKTVRGR